MISIPKFRVVEVDSTAAGTVNPTVIPWTGYPAEQPGLSTSHRIVGVTMTDSQPGEAIVVMSYGPLRGCDEGSETWAVGDLLWAGLGGIPTKTRLAAPTPQIFVGVVVYSEGAGLFSVAVDVRVLPSLGEMSGVAIETPADKDVFIYESASSLWRPRQIDHGADLAGLTDDDHPQYAKRGELTPPHIHSRYDVRDLTPNDSQFILAGQIFGD